MGILRKYFGGKMTSKNPLNKSMGEEGGGSPSLWEGGGGRGSWTFYLFLKKQECQGSL